MLGNAGECGSCDGGCGDEECNCEKRDEVDWINSRESVDEEVAVRGAGETVEQSGVVVTDDEAAEYEEHFNAEVTRVYPGGKPGAAGQETIDLVTKVLNDHPRSSDGCNTGEGIDRCQFLGVRAVIG